MTLAHVEQGAFRHPAIPDLLSGFKDYAVEMKDTLDTVLSLESKYAMELLRVNLFHIHQAVSTEEWKNLVDDILVPHPLTDLCHKDPFTERAFSKPRGYAGDAVMIDYIYGFESASKTDEVINSINVFTINSASSRAVRNRLNFIVNTLKNVGESKQSPNILSVACGHCREFGLADTLHNRPDMRFIAFDQDRDSLNVVEKEYAPLGVTPMYGSVTDLIKRKGPEGTFDLIYALGLYDYLNQRLAVKVTRNLFDRLDCGGELIIANFVPNILDIGYMESFMRWQLIFRDRDQMADLAAGIPCESIAKQTIFYEPERNVIFLSLRKI